MFIVKHACWPQLCLREGSFAVGSGEPRDSQLFPVRSTNNSTWPDVDGSSYQPIQGSGYLAEGGMDTEDGEKSWERLVASFGVVTSAHTSSQWPHKTSTRSTHSKFQQRQGRGP